MKGILVEIVELRQIGLRIQEYRDGSKEVGTGGKARRCWCNGKVLIETFGVNKRLLMKNVKRMRKVEK